MMGTEWKVMCHLFEDTYTDIKEVTADVRRSCTLGDFLLPCSTKEYNLQIYIAELP